MSGLFDVDRGVLRHPTDVVETAEFFGPDSALFGYRHRPARPPAGGLVVCSPPLSEFIKNYRREVGLGRRLAESDIAVQRFEYRGTANSKGADADLSFDTMVADAAAAARHLTEWSGVERPAFLGTRLAAIVAASASNGSPLVLWDPAVDYDGYFKRLDRARALQVRAEGLRDDHAEPEPGPPPIVEQLAEKGWADAMGFFVYQRFHQSWVGRDLVSELGDRHSQVLVLQASSGHDLRPDLERTIDRLVAARHEVDWRVVAGEEENWWFRQGIRGFVTEEARPLSIRLIEETARWLADRFPAGMTR